MSNFFVFKFNYIWQRKLALSSALTCRPKKEPLQALTLTMALNFLFYFAISVFPGNFV